MKRPGPKPLPASLRQYVRRNIGFTPAIAGEIAFAENETGLSATDLVSWAWSLARDEIMRTVSESGFVYTNPHTP